MTPEACWIQLLVYVQAKMSGKWTVRPPDTMRHVGEDVAILRKDFGFLDSLLGEAAHQVGLPGLPAWPAPALQTKQHCYMSRDGCPVWSIAEAAPQMAS